jgi:hypothetical protein
MRTSLLQPFAGFLHTTLCYTRQIRIHIRYVETHPIISLSSPTHHTSLFWFGFEKWWGGRVTKFCTRHYSNTHTIGKDREVVGARRLTDPHSECLDDSQHRAPFSRCAILKCGRKIHDYAVLQPGTTIFPRMLAQKLERFWRHYSSAQFKFRP